MGGRLTIFDIDHTLTAPRGPGVLDTDPNPLMISVARKAERDPGGVLYLTGRQDFRTEETADWLRVHGLFDSGRDADLVLRPDHISVQWIPQWKAAIVARAVHEHVPDVVIAYDDWPENLDAFATMLQGVDVSSVSLYDVREGIPHLRMP